MAPKSRRKERRRSSVQMSAEALQSKWGHVKSARRSNAFLSLFAHGGAFTKRVTGGLTEGHNLHIERPLGLGEKAQLDRDPNLGNQRCRVVGKTIYKQDAVVASQLAKLELWKNDRLLERDKDRRIQALSAPNMQGRRHFVKQKSFPSIEAVSLEKTKGLSSTYSAPHHSLDLGDGMFYM